jgi:hypothetical protein
MILGVTTQKFLDLPQVSPWHMLCPEQPIAAYFADPAEFIE